MLNVCLDVHYYDTYAVTAYVLFKEDTDTEPVKTGHVLTHEVHPYEPGAFYKRELPCLLNALQAISEPLQLIIIDANVWLSDEKMGLGGILYESLQKSIPVIGVSKTKYAVKQTKIIPVYRGDSQNPLYVSAIGIDTVEAVQLIKAMAGPYRIPTLIKLADTVCRNSA
ncbi:MAG: endonuclease V [Sphingobacteriales bacterium]|nr:MAG: endonuclease V [Sphingobacteriales bacterium]